MYLIVFNEEPSIEDRFVVKDVITKEDLNMLKSELISIVDMTDGAYLSPDGSGWEEIIRQDVA